MIYTLFLFGLLSAHSSCLPPRVAVDYTDTYPRILGFSLPRVRIIFTVQRVYPIRRFLVAGDSKRNKAMLDLIPRVISPTKWIDMGGFGDAKFDAVQGTLVIIQEPDVHQNIVEFLAGTHDKDIAECLDMLVKHSR